VPTKPLRVGGSKQARRVMNRRNRLSRAALVLALLVLAGIVTGVAESATKTAIPKQLTGRWGRLNYGPEDIVVGPGARSTSEMELTRSTPSSRASRRTD
jgi:hypothetical protein